jgi:hypothetical protein
MHTLTHPAPRSPHPRPRTQGKSQFKHIKTGPLPYYSKKEKEKKERKKKKREKPREEQAGSCTT